MASANPIAAQQNEILETHLASEVRVGLTSSPKTLSPWLFYDAPGSALFEQITELPEYYLTRTERAIFSQHALQIVRTAAAGNRLAVVELGAGTASKTGLLLAAAVHLQGSIDYYAIDVSESALTEAKRHLELEIDDLRVHLRVGDYTDGLGNIQVPGFRKLVLYIGSSIGNFEPDQASALLRDVRSQLAPGDQLLIGADLVKDASVLLAAYNDAAGVTAAFNRNLLSRINRELGGTFQAQAFEHVVLWNAARSRIEMHLRSEVDQSVEMTALGLRISFREGETIHTENSYKFTEAAMLAILQSAGFVLHETWTDSNQWFAVYLAEAS
jgi:L-histidine N-alpha-methyltransferase